MDRISVLPKTILHDILARLPEKDAARTSVLSNEWRDTWYSFPILSICDKIIIGSYSPRIISKLDILIGYVMRRLLKLCEQSFTIKVFKLDMMPEHNKYMSHHFDLWMNMVSENRVEVLELCLLYSATYHGPDMRAYESAYRYDRYDLPHCVFEVKSLTKLVLKGKITLNQSFFNHSIKLFSLRTLCLRELLLEDKGIIEHLISHCPLLEDLTVYCCLAYYRQDPFGNKKFVEVKFVESLFLHGLQKLKEADIQGIQEIYIDAPNLENLRYVPFYHLGSPFKVNLDSFTRLRCLRLWKTDVTDKWLLDLSHKFPFLEHLELCSCPMLKRINISSARLMILEFSNDSDVKEVNIDAPNLLSFDYCGDHRANISFLTSSDHLVFNASPALDYMQGYYSLREFIQNIKPQKVLASLSLSVFHSNGIEQNCLSIQQVSSIPPTIKCLELDSSPNEALYFHYMNWLLSCCCPKTISFFFQYDPGMKPFTVFIYELLMGRKKQEWFDHFGDTKCWWHDLKVVKVTYSFNVDEKVDFKTALNALILPTDHWESVSFSLEL